MIVNSPRTYNSPQRDEQANATRRRIMNAAAQLFATHGFSAVSVGRIARESKVSLATVYLHFAGKAAIVGALADDIAEAPELSVELIERVADPQQQLRLGAAILRAVNERSWLIADILRSARGSDADLDQIRTLWQERHLSATRRGIAALQSDGALREGLAFDDAVDIIYALSGTDVYRALVHERGWSPEQYEHWLFQIACRELLPAPSAGQ
jgi:AcrR family transcriptional regulator